MLIPEYRPPHRLLDGLSSLRDVRGRHRSQDTRDGHIEIGLLRCRQTVAPFKHLGSDLVVQPLGQPLEVSRCTIGFEAAHIGVDLGRER